MSRFVNLLHRLGIDLKESRHDNLAGGRPVAHVEFRIPNLVCEGCAEKIDGALQSLAGVREVRSNVAQKRILVRYEAERVRPEQLEEAVRKAGFTVVEG